MDLRFLNTFLDVLSWKIMISYFLKIELENELEWLHKNILIATISKQCISITCKYTLVKR